MLDWEPGLARPVLVKTLPMPVSKAGRIDAYGLNVALWEHRAHLVVVEQVGSAPGQGVASAFQFGRGVGAVEAVVDLGEWEQVQVLPTVWKGAYRLPGGAEGKQQSVTLCEQLVGRALPDGEAEAVLIAWWACKHRGV